MVVVVVVRGRRMREVRRWEGEGMGGAGCFDRYFWLSGAMEVGGGIRVIVCDGMRFWVSWGGRGLVRGGNWVCPWYTVLDLLFWLGHCGTLCSFDFLDTAFVWFYRFGLLNSLHFVLIQNFI